ncbi:MAG TPA: methylated-DNA--[protein]-cysteine S-methyltransferase [Solirubrobacter sp.]|nr:methylated-DNA--[protein]-cysteine S-methyltransferase [Solirubrobacter sp.]
MHAALLPSPIGPIYVERDATGLTKLYTNGHRYTPSARAHDDAAFTDVKQQLDEYFAGERTAFDLPLAPQGTPFELTVWEALQRIPYGETCSYGALAHEVGSVARAVGGANGRNPISIIVPCHRVIGADGSLTGYGGGLDIKRALLDLEQGIAGML